MKKFFKEIGFRKMDEMEKTIQLQAIRLSWLIGIVGLLTWSLYESYKARIDNGSVNLIPSWIAIGQVLMYSISNIIMRKRIGGGGEKKRVPLSVKLFYVIAVVAFIALIHMAIILVIS